MFDMLLNGTKVCVYIYIQMVQFKKINWLKIAYNQYSLSSNRKNSYSFMNNAVFIKKIAWNLVQKILVLGWIFSSYNFFFFFRSSSDKCYFLCYFLYTYQLMLLIYLLKKKEKKIEALQSPSIRNLKSRS